MSTLNTVNITNGTDSITVEGAVKGSAKAWVNFNGTGTVAIRASYNVSSITDVAVGKFIVNFSNALTDSSFSAVCSAGTSGLSAGMAYPAATPSASSCPVESVNANDVLFDATYTIVAVFR
jgi:hypothetical protein